MREPPLHALAAALELQDAAAALERRRAADRERQQRAQAKKRAARRGQTKVDHVINHQDHVIDPYRSDPARVAVAVDLDPGSNCKKSNAGAKRVIAPTDRPRVHEGFRAAAKALRVEYPDRERMPFGEKRACELLLEEYEPDQIARARDALAQQKRSGDDFERRKPFTLAFLRRHMLELLQLAPPKRPAPPRRQLELDAASYDAAPEGPQPRILPAGAPPRRPVEPVAAREVAQAELAKLRERGLA